MLCAPPYWWRPLRHATLPCLLSRSSGLRWLKGEHKLVAAGSNVSLNLRLRQQPVDGLVCRVDRVDVSGAGSDGPGEDC